MPGEYAQGVVEHATDDPGAHIRERVVTHRAPRAVMEYLHAAAILARAAHQTDVGVRGYNTIVVNHEIISFMQKVMDDQRCCPYVN